MLKMSTVGQNACIQTFAKVVLLVEALVIVVYGKSSQICCSALFSSSWVGWSLVLTEVCEMLEASHPTYSSEVG